MTTSCKQIIPILFLIPVILSGCNFNSPIATDSDPNFERVTLEQVRVNTLKQYGDYLYAGTAIGLMRKSLDTLNDSLWENMALDKNVLDFVVQNKNSLIVAVEIPTSDSEEIALFKTSDQGNNWIEFQNNFGGENKINRVKNLEQHPQNPDILYATGGGGNVVKSTDGGQNWKLAIGFWDHTGSSSFVVVDRRNPSTVWSGGMDAIFEPYLRKSTDGGETWTGTSVIRNGGSTNDILIHSNNSDKIVIAVSRAIYQTTTGGDIWERTMLFDSNFIFTLEQSLRGSEIVYASGKNKERNLFIVQSDDFGKSWETVVLDSTLNELHILDLLSVNDVGRELLFLGTSRGIYRHYPEN